MNPEKGLQIVLAAHPHGKVTPDDFRLEYFSPPEPALDEFLIKVDYLSLDPYMRGRMDDRKSYAEPAKIGEVMPGESVGTIIASNHPGFSQGDVVLARTGWRTHAISTGAGVCRIDRSGLPVTTRLGVLGMPGFTAYAGMKAIGKPQRGETVVVAAATGPVGSLVGQLARIDGAGQSGLPVVPRNAPIWKRTCISMPRSITDHPIFAPLLPPPARMGSMSTLRMLAEQCGRPCSPS